MFRFSLSTALALVLAASPALAQTPARPAGAAPSALGAQDYRAIGQAELQTRLRQPRVQRPARNVIIFVGDGLGVSTLTAARIRQGQMAGVDGASLVTAMDRLPYSALVKTYTHDSLVADSAPTATALLSGVKANNGTVGVDSGVAEDDCTGMAGHEAPSLLLAAGAAGLATGVVTTTRITHATPAAAYAHTPQRDWESDADMPAAARQAGCTDIAQQLISGRAGLDLDVVFGGGRAKFMLSDQRDPEYADVNGVRSDGRDLIADWQATNPQGDYVWNAAGFEAIDPGRGQKVLGLFEPDHMRYESERAADPSGEPSLAEMTRKAIEILSRNGRGYVLLVEAGRIDHAHHVGRADLALDDTVALDAAVEAALGMVNTNDTLVLVTADHSHALTMSGYPSRDADILDVVNRGGHAAEDAEGRPYHILNYATGPGAMTSGPERNGAFPALVPMRSAAHGGEDVTVRAIGPWAHLFSGTLEQQSLYHIVRHAMGRLDRRGRPTRLRDRR